MISDMDGPQWFSAYLSPTSGLEIPVGDSASIFRYLADHGFSNGWLRGFIDFAPGAIVDEAGNCSVMTGEYYTGFDFNAEDGVRGLDLSLTLIPVRKKYLQYRPCEERNDRHGEER